MSESITLEFQHDAERDAASLTLVTSAGALVLTEDAFAEIQEFWSEHMAPIVAARDDARAQEAERAREIERAKQVDDLHRARTVSGMDWIIRDLEGEPRVAQMAWPAAFAPDATPYRVVRDAMHPSRPYTAQFRTPAAWPPPRWVVVEAAARFSHIESAINWATRNVRVIMEAYRRAHG